MLRTISFVEQSASFQALEASSSKQSVAAPPSGSAPTQSAKCHLRTIYTDHYTSGTFCYLR